MCISNFFFVTQCNQGFFKGFKDRYLSIWFLNRSAPIQPNLLHGKSTDKKFLNLFCIKWSTRAEWNCKEISYVTILLTLFGLRFLEDEWIWDWQNYSLSKIFYCTNVFHISSTWFCWPLRLPLSPWLWNLILTALNNILNFANSWKRHYIWLKLYFLIYVYFWHIWVKIHIWNSLWRHFRLPWN